VHAGQVYTPETAEDGGTPLNGWLKRMDSSQRIEEQKEKTVWITDNLDIQG
jgi:hypothetical protein